MVSHEKVQLITPGQIREFLAASAKAIPLDLPFGTAQEWIGLSHEGWGQIYKLGPGLIRHLINDETLCLSQWQTFYKAFFGLDVDFSGIRIPESRPGFDRLLIIAKNLTPNQVYEACKQNFPCWRYTEDLDSAITHNDRNPTDHYAIWVRDRQEADEDLKNLSANQIKERGIRTETLTECLVHGLKYWSETKKHLDERNITLCAGSRSQVGFVPSVFWSSGEVGVDWYSLGHSSYDLRSREAVS